MIRATPPRLEEGLYTIHVLASEKQAVMEMMRSKVRNVTRLENATQEDYSDLCVLGRMLYELSGTPGNGRLTSLSREDIDVIYSLPLGAGSSAFLSDLNDARANAVFSGKVSPVTAARVARSFAAVIES